ncbi:MAG: hypothetical protein H0V22_08700, partial [Solirubrobacterales bacterium]|nr:hypothetical protein [Solirubrobacterales bacterium]
MTDRRRNLFILLLVLGLVAGSVAAIAIKPTRLGLDLQGGVQLIYQGKPTKAQPQVTQEALDRSLDLLRQRVDAFGVAEPEILLAGRDQLEVDLPGVEDADRAADQVGTTAQLFLYDWERNILDEKCKTNDTEFNGGQTATTGLFNAVTRASKCPPDVDANNSASGPRFYIFGANNRPLANGQIFDSEREARDAVSGKQAASAKILEIPEGVVVVRDEKGPANTDGVEPPDPDRWWVLRDDPALSGTDIRNPEQNFDQQGGN